MENFRSNVLNIKSTEEFQQQIYFHLVRAVVRSGQSLTFTLLNNNSRVLVDCEPLLSCLRSSQIPIQNVKSVKVRMVEVFRSDWAALQVLFKGGVLLNEVVVTQDADYSPLIINIIERGRSFRLDYKAYKI